MQDHLVNSLNTRVAILTAYLKQLKVVINFLSVMSHIEQENSLGDYMKATFGRYPDYLSGDIKLKHVKHVWLVVKYVQTDLLKRQHQVIFIDFRQGNPKRLELANDAQNRKGLM